MEKSKKIRSGSGVKKNDTWLKGTLNLDVLKEHAFEYNGISYVKVDINIYPSVNDFGKDVAIFIDQYVPDKTRQNTDKHEASTAETKSSDDHNDDLPF
jgi:hypothetical protein